jgi:hypothetical protein
MPRSFFPYSKYIAEQGWKSCIQLTNLNLNHIKMVEAMGLKIMALRSPWMASSPYKILLRCIKQFKSW